MEITNAFILSSYFTQIVIILILIGILITEFFNRKKGERKNIVSFLILPVGVAIYFILEIYLLVMDSVAKAILLGNIFISAFLVSLFLFDALKCKRYIPKLLSFATVFFGYCISINGIFRVIYGTSIFNLINAAVSLFATIFLFFTILNFLINSSGGKK